ncbi:MAG: uncharacterized protein KVP18_003389 [Porospora cf. gigantea A]|uniref:uncharacterized protein n=1 Tax=Porospora cf. gigantea A TaxID=2853593 RepID=UPI00355A8629|nr:MAG: hypothetical protein KVP18_003389 [Porospora cf. gigantea A]
MITLHLALSWLAVGVPVSFQSGGGYYHTCIANVIHPQGYQRILELQRKPVDSVQDVWQWFLWGSRKCKDDDFWCIEQGECIETGLVSAGLRRDGDHYVLGCLQMHNPNIESPAGYVEPPSPPSTCGAKCPTSTAWNFEVAALEALFCDGPDWFSLLTDAIEERVLGNPTEECAMALTTGEVGFETVCAREFYPPESVIATECYSDSLVNDIGTTPEFGSTVNIFPALLSFWSSRGITCARRGAGSDLVLVKQKPDGFHAGCLIDRDQSVQAPSECLGECPLNPEFTDELLRTAGCHGSGWTGIRVSALWTSHHGYHNIDCFEALMKDDTANQARNYYNYNHNNRNYYHDYRDDHKDNHDSRNYYNNRNYYNYNNRNYYHDYRNYYQDYRDDHKYNHDSRNYYNNRNYYNYNNRNYYHDYRNYYHGYRDDHKYNHDSRNYYNHDN